jgi:arylsulfatase A-like enzyme
VALKRVAWVMAAALLAACGREPDPIDLVPPAPPAATRPTAEASPGLAPPQPGDEAPRLDCATQPPSPAEKALQEAEVAGRNATWVRCQSGKQVRINDVVRRTLPASPPSRLRYTVDIPKNARLSLSCGMPEERHDKPGVEFVVKVVKDGREETVFTQLLDPVARPAHRKWLSAEVDLAKFAGKAREIVLETRGFDQDAEDARRAFWGDMAITAPREDAPLVIVYLVDTLRADHTTPYGYARNTTPHLLSFSKDAVVFDQAISHASWTKPSVASLFTSQLPGRHRAVQLRDSLDLGHATLAEMLQLRGFSTGAAIANSVIYSTGTNFEQGFDFYAGLHGEGNRPSKLVEAAGVVDEALRFLEARRGFPTFLYVHTMDPHVPYQPPAPFDRMFEPHPTPDHPAVDPRYDFKEPKDRDRLMAQYDGDIAYGDQEFGRFVKTLKERGVYDRALIVFVADHGEEFEDHGKWLHGRSVFDELIRVPLIVKFPKGQGAGQRLAHQVQTVDILPTVLEAAGLPVPAPPIISGRPLQAVLKGGAPEPRAVSEISHRGFVAHGIRTREDKYIQRFSPEEGELYFNLQKDPKEMANLSGQAPERVRQLRADLEQAMVPNAFRHVLRFTGTGRYELKLRTNGWIEAVEPIGFGLADKHTSEGNGRKLALLVSPRAGQPREVAFGVRPMGAPVWLEGTRDGRPLTKRDILIAAEGIHPEAVPFPLPEIESEKERVEDIFSPPREPTPGIHIWLSMPSGKKPPPMDCETCERLKALGYITGECPGC